MKLGEKRRLQASHLLSFKPPLKKGDSLNKLGLHIRGSVNDVGFLYGAGAPMFTDVHGVVRAFTNQFYLGWKDHFSEQDNVIFHNLLHGAGARISMDSFFAFCFSMWMIDEIFSDGVPRSLVGHGRSIEEGSGWVWKMLLAAPLLGPLVGHDLHFNTETFDHALVCDGKSLGDLQTDIMLICIDNRITQISAWIPWDKCCRLGEASNPGPDG